MKNECVLISFISLILVGIFSICYGKNTAEYEEERERKIGMEEGKERGRERESLSVTWYSRQCKKIE
jgi:hypothetical protein